MSWADQFITTLVRGETTKFRPFGGSMKGKISSGQLCTVEPLTENTELRVGSIVLCRVRGRIYLHLIKQINREKLRYEIGNNLGHVNGWITRKDIYGVCVKVED